MTAEERVRAAMNFERPDRVPYWDSPWDRFIPAWQRYKKVGPEVLPQDYYQSDILMPIPADAAASTFLPMARIDKPRLVR